MRALQCGGILFVALAVIGTFALIGSAIFTVYAESHPARAPVTSDPSSFELPFEEISLAARDGVKLSAWYVPGEAGKPAIVLVHGIRANRAQLLDQVRFFAQCGFSTLVIDLRNHGESEGTRTTFGWDEGLDVEAAVKYLGAARGFPAGSIGVYAVSMGAAAAIRAAPWTPEVGAYVLDSSYARLRSIANYRIRERLGGLMPALGYVSLAAADLAARIVLGIPPRDIAPVDWLAGIGKRPVLFIHGAADRSVPVEQARVLQSRASEVLPGETGLWIVRNAGHVQAWQVAKEKYERRIRQFFEKHLLPPPVATPAGAALPAVPAATPAAATGSARPPA